MRDFFPRRFGPYILAAPLGDGGVGDVCLALSPDGAPCAVKRIWRSEGPRADIETRFRREGEVALRLRHPAIAETVGFGEVEGELYIVEEFVEGVDLANLGKADIPLPVAVYLASEIAAALGAVHSFEGLGLVHRDVAPANIRLSFDGRVKLFDFGLVTGPTLAGMTAPGTVLGRLPYLAPEAKRGMQVGPTADVYSLGVILWELLARRRFLEEQERARSKGHPVLPLLPSQFNPDVPGELDRVVARATVESPAGRFGSAKELERALRACLSARYDGEAAVRGLLAQLYDVDKARETTRTALARARALVVPGEGGVVPGESLTEVRSDAATTERMGAAPRLAREGWPRLLTRWVPVAVFAGAVLILGGVLLMKPDLDEPAASVPARRPAAQAMPVAQPSPPAPALQPTAAPTSMPPARASRPGVPATGRPVLPSPPKGAPPSSPALPAMAGDTDQPQGRVPSAASLSEGERRELVRQAETHFHTKEWAEAERLVRQALGSGGGSRERLLLGQILLAKKQFKAAATELAEVVRLDPHNRVAARQLELARTASRGEE